jgi:pimeloyl-ACP methyl ester carboxylesterase
MPRAKAAADVYDPQPQECLRRVTDPDELKKMGIKPEDLRDDASGFHAEVYHSYADGKTYLTFQGVDPNSYNDWDTSIKNGAGIDTAQYSHARSLARKMQASGVEFDVVGHSLGGGLAQEAGLIASESRVYTFNSAGLHEASLARTGARNFDSLDRRTQAFRTQDDYLTYMQETRDYNEQLENARYLYQQLRGEADLIDPIQIRGRNTQFDDGDMQMRTIPGSRIPRRHFTPSRAYAADVEKFFNELREKISEAERSVANGRNPNLFPPARGERTMIPGETNFHIPFLNRSDEKGGSLAKLKQHQMKTVMKRMEEQKTKDERELKKYTSHHPRKV